MHNYTYPQSSSVVDENGDITAHNFYNSSPVDQTDEIPTTGASGSYSEATVTGISSSISQGLINELAYKRCHDTGHAATAKLIPTLLFPGFAQSGLTQFPDALLRRMASYVDPSTGRAPLPIAMRTRGRNSTGITLDYAQDGYDAIDILDHAVSAVGSNVYGYSTTGGASAICIGYSTGGLDALNFAARFPDRCLAVILYYPNYDLGCDPKDSYYMLNSLGSSVRTQVAASVQPGGDVRLTPTTLSTSANMDQYIARNAIDAIARIMAIPGGPHVWLLSDLDETEPLPSATRLKYALQSIPAAKGKAHIHLTQTGDSNRILHADGVNGASEIYAERYYFPYLLKNAAEWTIPRRSPPGDLRLLGYMKTKLFQVWMGSDATHVYPSIYPGDPGLGYAAEFKYDDYARRFEIIPKTSADGYAQVIRDADKRVAVITAGSTNVIDLNVIRKITSVEDVGYQISLRADAGVTNSSGVTSWIDQLQGLDFTASTNKPSVATDADGKSLVRFNAASSQKLVLSSLAIDPGSDFTISCVINKTDSSTGSLFELSHHGNLERVGLSYSGTDVGYARDSVNGWSIANTNGIGSHTWSLNAKHTISIMRKSNVLYISLDGGTWSYSPYVTTTFTTTGTNTTSIGAGWANGAGAYWQFFTGDIYEIDFKQSATSEVDIFSYNALMKTRWTF